MSQVVIAGGSGYLGRALAARLAREGHQVVVLTRAHSSSKYEGRSSKTDVAQPSRIRYAEWTPDGTASAWAEEIATADAVVNLAGAGIADRRWTESRKRLLVESRILSTRSLVAAIREAEKRPSLFVQASGIGYYGSFEDGPALDESSPPGDDFLAKLCVTWEGEAQPVQAFDCRLVIIRSGIVLSKDGGALKKMMLPFRLFAGGPLGSGRQQMSWIHRDDWIGLVAWAIRLTAGHRHNQRHGAESRGELGIQPRAGARDAAAELGAGAGIRPEAHRRRNGGGGVAARTACAAHARAGAGICVSVSGAQSRAGGRVQLSSACLGQRSEVEPLTYNLFV
jgi:uncharacterized protein (TIGR01777 family)